MSRMARHEDYEYEIKNVMRQCNSTNINRHFSRVAINLYELISSTKKNLAEIFAPSSGV